MTGPSTEPVFPIRLPRTTPLLEGILIRRFMRFMADVELRDGRAVTAHCVNTGTMEGLTLPGTRVWLSESANPNRKLKFTWELAEKDGRIIGANTAVPNQVMRLLIAGRRLPWLASWLEFAAERTYGEHSRIDFWLRMPRYELYLEVKNCHLLYPDGRGYFPDSVSERATGHLHELTNILGKRTRAEVLFFCQIPGVKAIRPSDAHDPVFAAAAREARRAGVRFSALGLRQTPEELIVEARVPVDLKPYRTDRIARWKKLSRTKPTSAANG